MGSSQPNVWHQVHAQREDGVAAMFLIRDVQPRADQPKIFVVELPYAVSDLSGQPDAAGYRRLAAFQEQWVEPACAALGWTFVAWKSEDGSFFLYLYGAGDPEVLLEKLAPFDGELGFFNDLDAEWSEYAALRELVEQAESEEMALDVDDDDADDDDDDDDEDGEDDCAHGHVHGEGCGHGHEFTVAGMHVIDLTGEALAAAAAAAAAAPAASPKRRAAATRSSRRTAPKPRAAAAKRSSAITKPAKRPAATAQPARAAKPTKRSSTTRPLAVKRAQPTASTKRRAAAPSAAARGTAKPRRSR